jgi:hypothetical protein
VLDPDFDDSILVSHFLFADFYFLALEGLFFYLRPLYTLSLLVQAKSAYNLQIVC